MKLPWVPPGRTAQLPGRGEIFYRHHERPDAPATLLLLHGWTASADLQFFTAYEELAEQYSFVAVDHRGHGRGIRAPFTLEDAADDAAALVRQLGVGPVVLIGFSMGGPISLLFADRHPDLVAGIIVQATAMEWKATRRDRAQWKGLGVMGMLLRSRWHPRLLEAAVRRILPEFPDVEQWMPWLEGEVRRGDALGIIQAGRGLAAFDARPWAGSLGRPAGMLVTTADRLVKPRKQWQLAKALRAEVRELPFDHLCTLTNPVEYSAATRALVDHVVERVVTATA